MKVLLSWIFDHIGADFTKVDVEQLVYRFNQTTAEIEHWHHVELPLDRLFIARVISSNTSETILDCPELSQHISIAHRTDAAQDFWFLIIQENNSYRWATSTDFYHTKQFLLPACTIENSWSDGSWKQHIPSHDYVVDVDNKSITHRPDLWCHRGIAREIAAFLQMPLESLDSFIAKVPQQEAPNQISGNDGLSLLIKDPNACKRLAGLYIPTIENKPSLLPQAIRLLLVDGKPINAIVDATNYVMFDIGQPMHAFDASTVVAKKLIARRALQGETLTLLDGTTLELTPQDLVVADDSKPMALAGIMGGAATGIKLSTKHIILEAACFDATTIRLSSVTHKIRSEASARFEKSLDPNQNALALLRCVALFKQAGIAYKIAGDLLSLGQAVRPKILTISHQELERKLGITLKQDFVSDTLARLGINVEISGDEYRITIPTFRGTKDEIIPDDIIEEIGRFYGYSAIKPLLPYKQVQVHDLSSTMRLRSLKHHAAFGMKMREIATYALYDEQLLRTLHWEPTSALMIKNPVSDNWKRLVTSLIPHLCKAIIHNCNEHDSLRFFEAARTWHFSNKIVEQKSFAGIFYEKKESLDFYTAKSLLISLFDVVGLKTRWQQVAEPSMVWYMPYQTAEIFVDETSIGFAGMSNPTFFSHVAEGTAFLFELNNDFLLSTKPAVTKYHQISKFPYVHRDISILIDTSIKAGVLIEQIKRSDPLIDHVDLIDFFEKKEWNNQKSLTFRITLVRHDRTFTKAEVDEIYDKLALTLQQAGATIR